MYTNKLNLPWPYVAVVTNDPYSKGEADFSVTELLKPPRAREVGRRHGKKIVEDVADRFNSLIGKLGHAILERIVKEQLAPEGVDFIAERRLFHEFFGHMVSGQIDLLHNEPGYWKLNDFKFTKIWSVVFLSRREEWEAQQNIYRYMLKRADLPVPAQLEIIAFLLDHSKRAARFEKGYPPLSITPVTLALWSDQQVEEFVHERIELMEAAKKRLPQCTSEERWVRDEKWAVIKLNSDGTPQKRAMRGGVHNSLDNAETFAEQIDVPYLIDHRPGESIACVDYCPVRTICAQAKKYRGDQ